MQLFGQGDVSRDLKGLVHKGGLRAQIVTEGTIRVGDAVVAL
jgi:hypothetical protein